MICNATSLKTLDRNVSPPNFCLYYTSLKVGKLLKCFLAFFFASMKSHSS